MAAGSYLGAARLKKCAALALLGNLDQKIPSTAMAAGSYLGAARLKKCAENFPPETLVLIRVPLANRR
eukprot:116049-Prorocentrum_minimum.AAC.1